MCSQRRRQVIPVPTGIHLADGLLKYRVDDLLLVAEVVLQVALADTATFGNAIGRHCGTAMLVEELECRLQDSELRGARSHAAFCLRGREPRKRWCDMFRLKVIGLTLEPLC